MADTDFETTLENGGSVENSRIRELSGKAKTFAEERDRERQEKETALAEKQVAEKQASFYKEFSKLSSKYTQAAEHLDAIEAKVMAGYDPEDAVLAVLNKAGKLSDRTMEKPQEIETPAGGSAASTIKSDTSKSIGEMSQEERRSALLAAQERGDIAVT